MENEIRELLEGILLDNDGWYETEDMDGNIYMSAFIGCVMALDPCGKYHHVLSPNGITPQCIEYWDTLERVASELNCWIESGEGNATDVFLCQINK